MPRVWSRCWEVEYWRVLGRAQCRPWVPASLAVSSPLLSSFSTYYAVLGLLAVFGANINRNLLRTLVLHRNRRLFALALRWRTTRSLTGGPHCLQPRLALDLQAVLYSGRNKYPDCDSSLARDGFQVGWWDGSYGCGAGCATCGGKARQEGIDVERLEEKFYGVETSACPGWRV